jgi:putative transposase
VTVYRMISAEKAQGFPVSMACRLLGVSRSAFYEWERGAPSDRQLTDAWLVEQIKQIHGEHRGVDGWRRIHAELRIAHGTRVSGKRVRRLMRAAGISGLVRRKRGRTTIRVPGVRVADDLVERRFRPTAPNLLWVADITYLRTWEGWVTWPPSKTRTAARSSAGAWPITCAPSSSSTRSRWPSRDGGQPPAWSTTQTRAANT